MSKLIHRIVGMLLVSFLFTDSALAFIPSPLYPRIGLDRPGTEVSRFAQEALSQKGASEVLPTVSKTAKLTVFYEMLNGALMESFTGLTSDVQRGSLKEAYVRVVSALGDGVAGPSIRELASALSHLIEVIPVVAVPQADQLMRSLQSDSISHLKRQTRDADILEVCQELLDISWRLAYSSQPAFRSLMFL